MLSLVTAFLPFRIPRICVQMYLLWLILCLYYTSIALLLIKITLNVLKWLSTTSTNVHTLVLGRRDYLVDHSGMTIWSNDDVKQYRSRTDLVQIWFANHHSIMSPEGLRVLSKLSRPVWFGQKSRFSHFFRDDSLKNVERSFPFVFGNDSLPGLENGKMFGRLTQKRRKAFLSGATRSQPSKTHPWDLRELLRESRAWLVGEKREQGVRWVQYCIVEFNWGSVCCVYL